jgi:hypothetical protein
MSLVEAEMFGVNGERNGKRAATRSSMRSSGSPTRPAAAAPCA